MTEASRFNYAMQMIHLINQILKLGEGMNLDGQRDDQHVIAVDGGVKIDHVYFGICEDGCYFFEQVLA